MARRDEPLDQTESKPPEELTGTVVRGIGISGLGYVATQALTLVSFLVIARLVTPAEIGQVAAGTLLVSIGLLFTESGMLAALVHRRDRLDEAAATAVVSTFAAGLLFGLGALALSPLIGVIFDSGKIGSIAAATAGLLLLRTVTIVPTALLQRRFSFVRRVIVEPLGVLVFGGVAIFATANGLGAWGLVIGYYAQAVADVALSWGLARWLPNLRLASYGMWRELVSYGRHVFTASVIIRAANEAPVLLIGRYVGAGPLGQFRYGYRITTLPLSLLLAAASFVLFPAFARIATERDRFRAAFVRSLRWIAALGMPSGLLLVAVGPPTAVLVFGPTWAEAGDATVALAAFPAAASIGAMISEVFAADGRPELLTRMHGVEAVVGVAAMIVLLIVVPNGLIGVCAGVSIGAIAGAAYALWRVGPLLGVEYRAMAREILPPLVASLAMIAVLVPLETQVIQAADHRVGIGLALLAGEIALGVVLYVAVLSRMAPKHFAEFMGLVRIVLRRDRGAPPPPEVSEAPDELLEASTEPLP